MRGIRHNQLTSVVEVEMWNAVVPVIVGGIDSIR
jgi:hypothetical protein